MSGYRRSMGGGTDNGQHPEGPFSSKRHVELGRLVPVRLAAVVLWRVGDTAFDERDGRADEDRKDDSLLSHIRESSVKARTQGTRRGQAGGTDQSPERALRSEPLEERRDDKREDDSRDRGT